MKVKKSCGHKAVIWLVIYPSKSHIHSNDFLPQNKSLKSFLVWVDTGKENDSLNEKLLQCGFRFLHLNSHFFTDMVRVNILGIFWVSTLNNNVTSMAIWKSRKTINTTFTFSYILLYLHGEKYPWQMERSLRKS